MMLLISYTRISYTFIFKPMYIRNKLIKFKFLEMYTILKRKVMHFVSKFKNCSFQF